MRSTITLALTLSLLAAGVAQGQVQLVVRRDGKKVISNVPSGGGKRAYSDLSWLARRHDRRSGYDPIIERYAKQYGVDPVLIRAVIQVESNFDPKCVSHKGARGLMQLMPATAKRFGVKQIHDPEENIRGGVRYLAWLLNHFNDDLQRALAGYNAGEGAVLRYGGIPPYEETTTYVKRALTVYYGRPYGGGATSFAGRRGGAKLRGGFGRPSAVMAAVVPGMKVLGTN